MKAVFFIPFLLMLGTVICTGQETQLTIEVSKNEVRVGEVFTLSIKLINAQGDITPPDLSKFDVVAGPNYSSSFSMINGKTEMSSGYTYSLVAPEEGQYIIESASVVVDDVELYTEPIAIDVVYDPNYTPRDVQPTYKAKKKKRGIRL